MNLLVRTVLLAYPRQFRRDYGTEWERTIRDLSARDASSDGSTDGAPPSRDTPDRSRWALTVWRWMLYRSASSRTLGPAT